MTDPQAHPEVPEEEAVGVDATSTASVGDAHAAGEADAPDVDATEAAAGQAEDAAASKDRTVKNETGEGGDPERSAAGVRKADAGDSSDPLSEAMASIASLEDQLARRTADLYNVEQEYGNFVRRSKAEGAARREEGVVSVITALLPVLDDAELARQHGELTGPVGAILDKVEQTLRSAFGVERYGAEGDDFDPQVHEALMHSSSADVQTEQIGTLIQPGYRIGEKIVRAARVGVVSPE